MSLLTEGFTVCLFLKEFLETESYKIDFIITEESPRRKQKAGKERKVQEMMTEGILKVIYIHIIQLNRSTMATLGTEKNGHCREVSVSGDSTVVDNRKERSYLVL